MGLSRKQVEEIITGEYTNDEKIDKLINGHSATVDYYKEELGKYTDYDVIKEKLQAYEDAPKNDWEDKYSELESQFNQYKSDIEARDARLEKTNGYRNKLIEAGIDIKRLDTIIKVTDIDSIDLDTVTVESITGEWGDFIPTTNTVGATTTTPADGDNTAVTAEQFKRMSYADRAAMYLDDRELYDSLVTAIREGKV